MSWDHVPKPTLETSKVSSFVEEYEHLHEYGDEAKEKRVKDYAHQTNTYYDLVTDFYERGWGSSFHFAPRFRWESFEESLRRHEYYLALKLNLHKGLDVLDIGCGIGGPMRSIANFSGANITGINNNSYQISRVEKLNAEQGMDKLCSAVKGDFMNMPFPNEKFGAAYQIEATAHAPSKVEVYKEIYRTLKPGALFAGYEWVLTDKYDNNNQTHVQMRRELEMGSGIPSLPLLSEIKPAFIEAGFEIIELEDLALTGHIPWYESLAPVWTKNNWQLTPTGKNLIYYTMKALEVIRVVPNGTCNIQNFLQKGGEALYKTGKEEIFSPCYFHLVRKPE